jgi:hypothetical protein
MWAGSLSHNNITGLGALPDFCTHALGHELSAKYDVAHGESLSAVWGAWANYVYKQDAGRFAQYGRNVWDINSGTDDEIARAAIAKTVEYFSSLNMPTCFSEVAEMGIISDKELNEMADGCTYQGTRESIGSFKPLYRQDMYEVYKLANK